MNRIIIRHSVPIVVCAAQMACAASCCAKTAEHRPGADQIQFIEAHQDFPREEKNLRKWDAPTVADLDQDGYLDLILNDHGFGLRVVWNNQGRYAKPYDLIMGDLHGVTVGDLDQDGKLEILVSPGGGAGSNARNARVFRVDRKRNFTELPAFREPLKLMRGRTVKFVDGDNDGDLDLINFAFPSEERNGQSENYIYRNDGQGQLELSSALPPIEKNGQKTLVTDFNGDGVADLLLYGHKHVIAYVGNGDLSFKDVTETVFPSPVEDVTCIVELDYDNDGDFDLLLTRGKEFQAGETFFDQETSTWGFFTTRVKFKFEDLVIGDILKLENYQAQWPNKKLYIGESAYEYEFPGETHSGRDIRLVNSDALGWPVKTPEKGAYLGYVGNEAWRLAGDIWSPTTGIIRGVRTYPVSEHPEGLSDILLENRNGKFFDVTKQANLFLEDHTTGAAVADFDNNGFKDVLVIRRGDLVYQNESIIYLNRGKAGFERMPYHNVVSPELGAIGMGADTLDYNHDGKPDILIGNERGKWHLFRNQMQEAEQGNYVVLEIGSHKDSRATSLGALVSVKAGENEQVQHVGATGAAYSLSYNKFIHFGLGVWDGPIDVKVAWTNGEVVERTLTKVNVIEKIDAIGQQ